MKKVCLLTVLCVALAAWPVMAAETEEASSLTEQAQMSAEQENAPALYYLGLCYENGWGVEKDYAKAADSYKLAADQGLDCAQYNLGLLYQLGDGVEQDYEKAFEYYSLSAEQGYPQAQTALGFFYNQGLGTEQDYEKMLEYYNLAAEQGEPMAQFNLGCCYRDGIGVEQDYEEMIRLFRLAADKGNANAEFNLGFCYYTGMGVDQDYEKAFQLFQQSAEQGFPVAMFAYGDCYYLGNGVDKDLKKAAEWYQKSLDAGYEPDETDQEHLTEVLGEDYTATGSEEDDASGSQTGHMDGGWEMIPHEAEELPEDAQKAFDKAVEGLVGAKYTPVTLLATQLVAGTNYCILCQVSPVVPDPEPKWALVYIYADLQGNAEIMNVYELYIDRHSGLEDKE